MVRDQVLESDNDGNGDESSSLYFANPELAEANNRSLASLIASRRCYACRQADDEAPSASDVMTRCEEKLPAPRFSYHAMLSSSREAESTSRSPSPSRSAA